MLVVSLVRGPCPLAHLLRSVLVRASSPLAYCDWLSDFVLANIGSIREAATLLATATPSRWTRRARGRGQGERRRTLGDGEHVVDAEGWSKSWVTLDVIHFLWIDGTAPRWASEIRSHCKRTRSWTQGSKSPLFSISAVKPLTPYSRPPAQGRKQCYSRVEDRAAPAVVPINWKSNSSPRRPFRARLTGVYRTEWPVRASTFLWMSAPQRSAPMYTKKAV